MSELGTSALKYADNGWHVFPLHGIVNGQCTCGLKCASPGKHPRTAHGLKDASVDPELIESWWARWPNANIGIATGPVSDLWVVDVDNKQSVEIGNTLVGRGTLSLKELESEYEALPESRFVETGGGGYHFYYTFTEGCGSNKAGVREGIDIRGDGGYVVAPPSIHPSGHVYQWGNGDVLPDAPPYWLVNIAHTERSDGVDAIGPDELVVEGSRNSYLHALGAKYRREQGFNEWQLVGLLMAHNFHQCSPPLSQDEVRAIAKSCAKYEYSPPVDLSEWTTGDAPVIPEGGDLAVSIEFLLTHPPEPPAPLVHGVMDCGTGVLFGGQPNVGKSWLVMDLAVAISSGQAWLDSFTTEAGPVLMIDEEGTMYGQYERFQMLFDGRRNADGTDYLSPIGCPLHVAIGSGIRLDTEVGITRVRRMLERYRPRIVLLDSLVRLHSGDENSAKSMSKFFEITKGLMRTYETTFCFTHHVRKPGLEISDPGDLLRGTSEIRAWPDTIFVAAPDAEDPTAIVVHHVKARYGRRMKPFRVLMQIDDDDKKAKVVFGGEIEPDDNSSVGNQNRLLRAMNDAAGEGLYPTIDTLADAVKRSVPTTRDYLKRMIRAGMIETYEVPTGSRPLTCYRVKGV